MVRYGVARPCAATLGEQVFEQSHRLEEFEAVGFIKQALKNARILKPEGH